MELVIKISEKVYNALTHIEFDANLVTDEMRKSIANGTPLPKGHGRLIDADKEIHELNEMKVQGETFTTAVNFAKILMRKAPTIIEADKVESEDKSERNN